MSISISSTEIRVTNSTYSFEDIYQYAVDNNKTAYIKKLGTSYEITVDLRLRNNATIMDSKKSITILGDLIQVHKGSTLQLGLKRANGSTYDGCMLSAPNIKNGYGFGCTTTSDSGNLFLYGSTIEAFGFWSFFSGDNHVEIIDCIIDGFGRIEGASSILRNITFKKSNGKYGILSPKGELQEMSNMSVFDSLTYSGFRCSVYHNPSLAGNLKIVGGSYDGYDKLAYIEDTSGADSLIFLDSDIKAGYLLERETNNVDFFHKFTFSPICRDAGGNTIGNVSVVCTDNFGEEVFSVVSDANGQINEEITYYFSDRNNSINEVKTPHTFEFTHNDISFTRLIYINKPLLDIPMYIVAEGSGGSGSGGDVDYDRIQGMIDVLKTDVCGCVSESTDATSTTLANIESGIKQVVREVSDEVNENQTILEKTGFKVVV